MNDIIGQLTNNVFLRQVVTLLTGSAMAQFITLLAAPLLTHLYSPSAFGALALFVTIVAALTPGVCGRYDVAVVVMGDMSERRAFFFIAQWLAAMLCLLSYWSGIHLRAVGGLAERRRPRQLALVGAAGTVPDRCDRNPPLLG